MGLLLLLIAVGGVPQARDVSDGANLSAPAVRPDRARFDTMGGAYLRAERRLEPFNQQLHLDRENLGLWGRINSTRAATMDAEHWPSLRDPTLSSRYSDSGQP